MQKVILGVTGGIAAYKCAELARLFVRAGSEVQVVMTPAATEFVTPLTLQTLTGRPVYMEMYGPESIERVRHVDLAEDADVMVIAPASANTIAKMAHGLADNLLTTTYLALTCPVIVVPSMNVNMFNHPAVQDNMKILASRGVSIMEPDSGELACGVYGRGRMPEPADIFAFTRSCLREKDFKGVKTLVTAGPTREPLDPVRYISNPSTGLMGFALARALQERGAEVILISGPTALACPAEVEMTPVNTAAEMYEAVMQNYENCSLVIKAAAVSDFRPARVEAEKVKKDKALDLINLEPTDDILKRLGQNKADRFLVGFAAETENVHSNARQKLERKNLDLIVVNNIKEPGAGFASQTNRVSLIDRNGDIEELPLMDKEALSHCILDKIRLLMVNR